MEKGALQLRIYGGEDIHEKADCVVCQTGGKRVSTSEEYIQFVLEQLDGVEDLTYRKMFGEI